MTVPTDLTPLDATGLVTDVADLRGRPFALADTGELLTGRVSQDGSEAMVRMTLGGPEGTVPETYLTYGEASNPNGGAADPAISRDAMVWTAHPDASNDLAIDDFVVYASDARGGAIRRIGASTPDVPDQGTGRNLALIGGPRLMIIGARAFWTDTVRVHGTIDANPDPADATAIGVALMSAPLDGSAPQVQAVSGWYASEDLCQPADSPAVIYLDSAISQAADTGIASLHRARFAADGTVVSDDVIWSGPETAGATVAGAAACGRTVTISWADSQDTSGAGGWAVEIESDGTTTVLEGSDGGSFASVIATPRALFLTGAGGAVDGVRLALDIRTRHVFKTFATAGYPNSLIASRTTVAWLESTTGPPDYEQVFRFAKLTG